MGDHYSYSLTTFSPLGKLVQIEYALRAVGSGKLALGIKAVDGVVIATEKKLSSTLFDPEGIEKISLINKSTGMTYSGLSPDFRVLCQKSRQLSAEYYQTYSTIPSIYKLTGKIASTLQEFTQKGGVRPFGVSVLLAGWDFTVNTDNGGSPSLYQADPSGAYWAWKATAIGHNSASARTFLEKRYKENLSVEDAIDIAILTLKESFDGVLSGTNCEIGVINKKDKIFRKLAPDEIKAYLDVQK